MDGVPLRKGAVYHLVLEQDLMRAGGGQESLDHAGPGEHLVEKGLAGRWSEFAATLPLNPIQPTGQADAAAQTLAFDGKSWTPLDRQPVYAMHLGYGVCEGDPCLVPSTQPVWSGLQQAQVLHFNCAFVPSGVELRLRKKGYPGVPLLCRLLEYQYLQGTYDEFGRVEIPASAVSGDWAWVKAPLKTDGRKVFTECFYVTLSSTAGAAAADGCRDCYELSGMEAPAGLQDAFQATFDGGAHRSRASTSTDGLRWLDRYEADDNVVVDGGACPPFQNYASPSEQLVPLPPRFSGLSPEGL
jgi:hypothetical protein